MAIGQVRRDLCMVGGSVSTGWFMFWCVYLISGWIILEHRYRLGRVEPMPYSDDISPAINHVIRFITLVLAVVLTPPAFVLGMLWGLVRRKK